MYELHATAALIFSFHVYMITGKGREGEREGKGRGRKGREGMKCSVPPPTFE